MPTYPLPYRINDFLRRQTEWAQAALEELDAFCAMPEDADIDSVARQQQRREKETRDMAREYHGLAREWADAADVSPEERAEITRRSQEAQALLDRLRARYAEADRAAEARKARTQDALNDLRRGRRSVNIYSPEMLESPGFIDKKT